MLRRVPFFYAIFRDIICKHGESLDILNMIEDIWDGRYNLIQGRPRPHHWKLKNMRQLAERIIAAIDCTDVNTYLNESEIRNDSLCMLRYALVLQLCCNCWTIQKSRNLALDPIPPDNLKFLISNHSHFQPMKCVGIFFKRSDGFGICAFRGTTTPRETLVDFRSLFSIENITHVSLNSFIDYYTSGKPSIHDETIEFMKSVDSVFVVGHSLGGALATLVAEDALKDKQSVYLVTWAGARSMDALRCTAMQGDNFHSLAVINDSDYVPFLHSLLSSTCQCCPIVYLKSKPDNTTIGRLMTHDILYYGYIFLVFGSTIPDNISELSKTICDVHPSCFLEVGPDAKFVSYINETLAMTNVAAH